ncbi:conserved hypothetical protein [Desulforapulum autotrophicum HRM2]|uniref:Uncharacterized protein n=1 Tax=Desulforapulum autotrophicum (strain ATCC 43914 / DSM 3382 / VKM B-1955 / HRM2) TaxID=177437 RepID=C0QHI9_DESAH|nr:hypothetical protein [Desulforapulum autotrophicum]ACN17848.1 conserved hypothetical protein [Desulforapulum autotrophicum HRM2]
MSYDQHRFRGLQRKAMYKRIELMMGYEPFPFSPTTIKDLSQATGLSYSSVKFEVESGVSSCNLWASCDNGIVNLQLNPNWY